jgi:hypothetical protein
MYNDLLVRDDFGELKQRVYAVFKEAVEAYRSGAISTREDLLVSFSSAISRLNDTIEASLFVHQEVKPDTPPTEDDQNDRLLGIDRDLVILFLEMRQLALLMTSMYNQIASEHDDLVGTLKRVSSKLGDYQLYRGSAGVLVSEGFADSSGLDIGSGLVEGSQCNLNYNEGIATLAVQADDRLPIKSISVDPQTFTGVIGSNEDQNSLGPHGTLSDITDGNPDSWTEFELTYFADEEKPDDLELTLLIELQESSILNFISIDPVNFGLLNGVIIDDIKVSSDGVDWYSIRGDMPLMDYAGEELDDVFLLSPASSKYSGVFNFTTLPRKVKYISVSLTQDTPYLIETSQGNKYRLAVGLRGIDLHSIKFSPESSLVSTVRDISGIIRKLAMLSAYMPAESDLANIEFSLSFDDGGTWQSIQPMTEDDWDQPEILNLEEDYTSLRFKITLKRNDEAFSSGASVEGDQELTLGLDVVPVNSNASPQQITTSRTLANSEVTVIDAPLGSRGDQDDNRPLFPIGTGTGDELRLRLPFKLYPRSDIRSTDISVYVSGVQWTRNSSLSAAAADARVFAVGGRGFVSFGDGNGVTGNGLAPAVGAVIEIGLEPEHLFFERSGDYYVAGLQLPSDGSVANTLLEHAQPFSTWSSTRLSPAGQGTVTNSSGDELVRYDLPVGNILSTLDFTELLSDGSAPVSYIFSQTPGDQQDNIDEVVGAGEWYIDLEAGTLYSHSSFTPDRNITLRYRYIKHSEQDSFELVKNGDNYQQVSILLDDLVTHQQIDRSGYNQSKWYFWDDQTYNINVTDGNLLRLSHGNIIRGTVTLEDGIFGADAPYEVDFLDGNTELYNVLDADEEEIADTSTVGVYPFTLRGSTNVEESYGIYWGGTGSTYFQNEVGAPPTGVSSDGDWHIDWATGVVTVKLAAGMSDVTASYAHNEGTNTSGGTYSVDYKTGIAYCKTAPIIDKSITYTFSKYRIHYNVGKALSPGDVTITVERDLVSIKTTGMRSDTVHVLFQYLKDPSAALSEVVEYFTPAVRDIRIRCLTDSMVI